MKQFQVTKELPLDGRLTRTLEVVTADYMKLEAGHLIFRNEVRGNYPETVRVFAPGAWVECEQQGVT